MKEATLKVDDWASDIFMHVAVARVCEWLAEKGWTVEQKDGVGIGVRECRYLCEKYGTTVCGNLQCRGTWQAA